MLKIFPQLLSGEKLHAVSVSVGESQFIDGKLSAGTIAKRVKNNQEASIERERLNALNGIVIGAYMHNETFLQFALPHRFAEPYYARYTGGMYYGNHVDDPIMGSEHRYRSDISTTLFLNSPDNYGGGELKLDTPFGEQSIKLQAGDAVVYPSSYLHRVEKVTSGQRIVAVSWIQSMIRSAEQRQVLFDLSTTRDKLIADNSQAAHGHTINNSYANLLRMWSDI